MREPLPACDVLGVGFGPSNLALAVAIDEHNRAGGAAGRISSAFYEKQPRFGWHRGMLIEGTTVQVSFLKDLVTVRTPGSRFSFLSYLHAKGRLVDFINHKNLFPSRLEFHDYFEWVAACFPELVHYDSRVIDLHPVFEDGVVVAVDALVQQGGPDGPVYQHRARNVVIAAGLRPHLPAGVVATERIWHSAELLNRLGERPGWRPRRIVVVGAGQSAAEIVEYLHRRYDDAEVCAVFSRYGYSPADDSSFANRVFDPEAVDVFFGAEESVRQRILGYHANTNYSVVDLPLIDELYRRVYQEQLAGRRRLRVLNLSTVDDVRMAESWVLATVRSLATGRIEVLESDAVIYATGYRPADPREVLGSLAEHCLRDDQDRLRINRNYELATDAEVACGIYLQGATEHTHGLGSGLLSNLAVRSGEIVRSIAERLAGLPERNGVPLLADHLSGRVL